MITLFWEFTHEQPTVDLRIHEIRSSFSPETLRLISACALRKLASLSDTEAGAYLGFPLDGGGGLLIPREFFVALANCCEV